MAADELTEFLVEQAEEIVRAEWERLQREWVLSVLCAEASTAQYLPRRFVFAAVCGEPRSARVDTATSRPTRRRAKRVRPMERSPPQGWS